MTINNITQTIASIPTINLYLNPASLSEDEAGKIVYIFTRSENINNPLTVNFDVSGSATYNTDYTQNGATTFTNSNGTITFAANSATAYLIIDPQNDTVAESPETVVLNLTPSSSYDIGFTHNISMIFNDDGDTNDNGDANDNELIGGSFEDILVGKQGNDTLIGNGGNDSLHGGDGDDFLYGGDGNDCLKSATGKNFIDGGDGDDEIESSNFNDTVIGGAGNDSLDINGYLETVDIYFSYTDPNSGTIQSIEELTLHTGSGNDYIISTAPQGIDSYANDIESGSGNDTIITGKGNDYLSGVEGNDTLLGGEGNDTLSGGEDDDVLTAVNPQAAHPGKGEIDTIYEPSGSDKFILGDEFNIYYDDDDTAYEGDQDYAVIVYFNPSQDIIQLQGSASLYRLEVLSPNETNLYIDKAGSEPDELIAQFYNLTTSLNLTSSAFTYITPIPTISFSLNPTSVKENDTSNLVYTFTRSGNTANPLTVNFNVSGTASYSTDYSQNGATTFNSTNGTITFAANSATATVIIDPKSDTVAESHETVVLTLASSSSYNLGTSTPITGTLNNDDGDAYNNELIGSSGVDVLDGKQGNDTLIGGAGNDTYVVDSFGDVVLENVNEGTDTVKSSISYILGTHLENLNLLGTASLNGTGNTVNNSLTGNSGNNLLVGLDGNDTLDGKTGNDTLEGGIGNDIYTIDAGDTITENANEGTDTLKVGFASYTLMANVENLTLTSTLTIDGTGNSDNNLLTGNSAANILTGLEGNDTLTGGTGHDTLVGGSGNDTLTGGTGQDQFVLNAPSQGIDRITDFKVEDDTLLVSVAEFGGGLTVGSSLDASQFRIGAGATTATTADHRFIYNSTNGALFFDPDGTNTIAPTQIATLSTKLAMTNLDISAIA